MLLRFLSLVLNILNMMCFGIVFIVLLKLRICELLGSLGLYFSLDLGNSGLFFLFCLFVCFFFCSHPLHLPETPITYILGYLRLYSSVMHCSFFLLFLLCLTWIVSMGMASSLLMSSSAVPPLLLMRSSVIFTPDTVIPIPSNPV